MIKPVSFVSFKSNMTFENKIVKDNDNTEKKREQRRQQTGLYKTIPVAVLMSLPAASGVMTSCLPDNRSNAEVSWFAVASSRLSDKDIETINETRQTPKHTVITKVDDYKTEFYKDDEGETRTREVPTGKWHYELVNNRSGLLTGTTTLPEGYKVKKDILGFIKIVPDGTKGIFIKRDFEEQLEIAKQNSSGNEINFIRAETGLLKDEQIEKINKTRVMPKGTIISQAEDGTYKIESDKLGLVTGTRVLPEGYEVRRNVLGYVRIVPIDQKSIFLVDKNNEDTVNVETEIDFLQAQSRLLTDKQIAKINKTRRMPEGTIIEKDNRGNYYITSDITGLSNGTRTVPKGYELKKDAMGFAVVVPIDTKGILIRE